MISIPEKLSNSPQLPIIAGILVGILASLFIQIYLVYLPNISLNFAEYITTNGVLPYIMLFWAAPIVTVGTPVFIYLRYAYIAPSIICLLIIALWTYGELTPGGDTSVAAIMFAFTPIYLGLYALAAGIEYGAREYLN